MFGFLICLAVGLSIKVTSPVTHSRFSLQVCGEVRSLLMADLERQ